MISSAIEVLRPTAPGVASGTALPAGPAGMSAYQVAVATGYVGTISQWLASLIGPGATQAQVTAAVQALLGQQHGIAQLDASGRQLLSQDQIRAWQVIRAAQPLLVSAGGTLAMFMAGISSDPDANTANYVALQGGTPAPPGGILASLLTTYLVTTLSQSSGQAAATLSAIWSAAAAITP